MKNTKPTRILQILLITIFALAAQPLWAAFVANPSFEANFTTSNNGGITPTDWSVTGSWGVSEVGSVFYNGGTLIPDRDRFAFIWHEGTLSQDISGLTSGQQYWVQFWYEGRNCCGGTMVIQVSFGGVPIGAITGVERVTSGFACPSMYATNYAANQPLSTLLKPYPFQSVSDSFGYVGNANYHSLQVMTNMRAWHGLTFNANYSWSRAIDDGGSFRTGYAIPAGTLANHPSLSYKADAIERTVSTSNQPQHFVLTTVWDWPFGKTALAENSVERAILGGFKFSGIYQAYSGSPLAITESSTQTNQAQASTAPPIMNPNFNGPVRQNGKKWGKGVSSNPNDANAYNKVTFITPSTGTTVANAAGPFMNPVSTMLSSYNYQFSDAPRTAPYGLTGPGNYQLDLAMVRSFPLHFMESAKLNFRAEWYNVTNHTQFSIASTAVGNASFGQVTSNGSANRKAAQFSARIEF